MSVILTALPVFVALINCPFFSGTVFVNSSQQLEWYLCNSRHGDLLLELKGEHIYSFNRTSVACVVSSGNSVTLKSNSMTFAVIKCDEEAKSTQILIFFNSTVKIERIVFKHCGGNLSNIPDEHVFEYLNSSSLHYTSSHAAALVFVYCKVNMSQVAIYHSHGFAIVGVNLHNSVLLNVNMSNASKTQFEVVNNINVGSGLVLHFVDYNMTDYDLSYNVSLIHCNFEYNLHLKLIYECPLYNYMNPHNGYFPITNSAGLTILYTQTKYIAEVQVNHAYFKRNLGGVAGAMLIVHYVKERYHMSTGSTIVENTMFEYNTNVEPCLGAGLAFYWFDHHQLTPPYNVVQPLIVRDSVFQMHYPLFEDNNILNKRFSTGAVYIGLVTTSTVTFLFERSNFTNNTAPLQKYLTGSCIYAEMYQLQGNTGEVFITLKDIVAYNNYEDTKYKIISMVGVFSFYAIKNITIRGSHSTFIKNSGSVIHAVDSNVYLYGHILFQCNQAMNGAAIRSTGQGQIHFEKGVIVNFVNNTAYQSGGALYLYNDMYTLPSQIKQCALQVSRHINVTFSGSIAGRSGNSIYASPLCLNSVEERNVPVIFTNHFHFINTPDNSLMQVSTRACSLLITCNHLNVHPGQSKMIQMAAVDEINNTVWSTFDLLISTPSKLKNTKVWLQNEPSFLMEGQKYTSVEITVLLSTNFTKQYIDALIAVSLPNFPGLRTIAVSISPCPLGFQLDNSKGKCTCNKALKDIAVDSDSLKFQCNIQNRTITPFHGRPWIGNVTFERVTKFGASKVCPLRYCRFENSHHVFNVDMSNNIALLNGNQKSVSLCLYNREDVLCGRCPSSLSVVFGSEECKHCHPGYIALTVSIFLIAGPLLIYLLFALRLTLTTGTFNGIIFYAQAANVGILDMLNVYNGKMRVVRRISIVLLSALNLGLGFPLCFYNGMIELWKAGLNLLFPLYLLTIVVVLIILSHFSLRISNRIAHSSVQVLVTVVHLSFGKLLGSIINVYTPAKVFTSEQTYHVWYWDGSVEYGSEGHTILMVMTSLVVFPLLISYVFLLLFAKPLRHCRCANEYTRPILEAIHAPYKSGKQYWFVARLLLLIMMYILYSIEPYAHVIYIAIASILFFFIIGQAMFRPYKSNFINLLDCWLLFNLSFLYITTWYQGYMEVTVYSIVAILLFFMTFFMVLVYHILFITGQLKKLRRNLIDIYTRVSLHLSHFNNNRTNQRSHCLPLQDANDSFYDSCDNFRESLLNN